MKLFVIVFVSYIGFYGANVLAQPFEKLNSEIGLSKTIAGLVSDPLDGAGISFADFNADGWDDLTFGTGNGSPVLFYQNNQDGTFLEIFPDGDIMNHISDTKSILWADIDNDGDKDCFLTGFESQNHLYLNEGNLFLTDITSSSGLNLPVHPFYGATFGDINNDGYLDLYICLYDITNHANYLFKNNGNNTFTDISIISGTTDSLRYSYAAAFFDYNNDGFQDLYVANDKEFRNSLYKNNGDGLTFTDVSIATGADLYMHAMNVGVGDFNNDGYSDIYITNTPKFSNALLKNNQDGTFEEISATANVSFYEFSWGANWLDFDNDTDLDLYVSSAEYGPESNSILYVNQYADADNIEFFENPWPNGLEGDAPGNSNAIGDFNNDGNLDIISSYGGLDTISLFKNLGNDNGKWLKINLQGVISNRDGIGTRVVLYAGEQKYMRYLHCGEAYICQNSNQLHFGLGGLSLIDSVKVHWLSGIVDILYHPSVNQVFTVVEGTQNAYLDIVFQKMNAHCFDADNGMAEAHITGNYQVSYLWNTGDTSSSIQQLVPGNYTVTVSLNGISSVATVEIGLIPEGEEIPNNDIDENCDGIILIIDEDLDGYHSDEDCNDAVYSIHPGATDIPYNNIDEDCNGIDLMFDQDVDGYYSNEDCNDLDYDINPGVNEIPNNQIDENCDGELLIIDLDNDGYNSIEDCNDLNGSINPGIPEIPNNTVDENCDNLILIIDLDNDGFNSDEDCNDLESSINPAAFEIPNNEVDEDCNGDNLIIDLDNDGYNSDEDCDDLAENINPAMTEIPDNGIDENCDGTDEITLSLFNKEFCVKVMTNPFSEEIILSVQQVPGFEATILNLQGNTVWKTTFNRLLSNMVVLNPGYLPSGAYFLKLTLENYPEPMMFKLLKI
jgi:hypothetical protein